MVGGVRRRWLVFLEKRKRAKACRSGHCSNLRPMRAKLISVHPYESVTNWYIVNRCGYCK